VGVGVGVTVGVTVGVIVGVFPPPGVAVCVIVGVTVRVTVGVFFGALSLQPVLAIVMNERAQMTSVRLKSFFMFSFQ